MAGPSCCIQARKRLATPHVHDRVILHSRRVQSRFILHSVRVQGRFILHSGQKTPGHPAWVGEPLFKREGLRNMNMPGHEEPLAVSAPVPNKNMPNQETQLAVSAARQTRRA